MTKNRLLFARPKPDFCSGKQAAGIAASVTMASLLIANGADVNIKDNKGYTPLHWAVCANIWEHEIPWHLKSIENLLQGGADLEVRTNEGETPLTLAKERNPGRPQIADLLKRYGGR
jgi:ankyrin repeat protein